MSQDEVAARRARRREAARRHHPDLGGDAAEFIAAMRAADRTPPAPDPARTATSNAVFTTTLRSGAARKFSTTRKRIARRVRARIPRSFPGSRRYGRL